MSLVAYASSDSEEDSEEQNAPSTDTTFDLTQKKQRETVKIAIPSLKQFKDEDAEKETNTKPKPKGGSGLFSMLPPPKHSGLSVEHTFKPHILTKKKSPATKPIIKKLSNSKEAETATSKTEDSEDIFMENANSSAPDYFSLESTSKPEENNAIETSFSSSSSMFSSLPEPAQRTNMYSAVPEGGTEEENILPSVSNDSASAQSGSNLEEYNWNENYNNAGNQAETEQPFIKDEEFKKITGRREMKDINFIDVNADDQLTDRKEWLMRSLTEETVHRPSKRKHGMPTSQQKRKHQITYLAYQAKERELDLKNQWAMNSSTRRETQAKYGF